jgi:fructokinase
VNALGCESALISSVGDDADGREIVERFGAASLPTDFIGIDLERPTGRSTVGVGSEGVPVFSVHENVAWDFIPYQIRLGDVARQASAVLFGTLGQRSEVSRTTVQRFVGQTNSSALRIFDANLRAPHYSSEVVEESLGLATVLKISGDELKTFADMFSLRGDEKEMMSDLAVCFGLRVVALTRGERGSVVIAGARVSEHPGCPCVVADTVGAGDAFAAALAVGMLRGRDIDRLNANANQLASFVCTKPGATPVLPQGLIDELAMP